jgi:hypothetical protein
MTGTVSWKQKSPNFRRVAIIDDEYIQPFNLRSPGMSNNDFEFRPMITEEVKAEY